MITGQLTEAEFVEAHFVHRHRLNAALNWIMAVIALAGLIVFMTASRKWGMIAIGGGVGGLLGELLCGRLLMRRKARHLFSQLKGITAVTYSWDDDKLHLRSESGGLERNWSDFLKAKESGELILLYHNDVLFEVVPKQWFKDAEQVADFRRHLRVVK